MIKDNKLMYQKIEDSLREYIRINEINYMPSRKDLEGCGNKELCYLIMGNGGFQYWGDRLNLPGKKNRRTWKSESEVEYEIKKIMKLLNLDRMPTYNEIKGNYGNDALNSKIIASGGFEYWANKLDLELKYSETLLGRTYEGTASKTLEDKGYKVERMSTLFPFDLLLNGCIKIDVKVANVREEKGKRVHTFATAKKIATCDLYIFIALNEEEEIENYFIIPSFELNVVTVQISSNSKYNKYLNKWDYIEKFKEFYSSF